MRIRGLFALGMGSICVLAGFLVAGETWRDWSAYRRAQAAQQVVNDYAAVMQTIKDIISERTPTNALVVSPVPWDQKLITNQANARARIDKSVETLRSRVAKEPSPYQAATLRHIADVAARLAKGRQVIDQVQNIADSKARAVAAAQAVALRADDSDDLTPVLDDMQRNIADMDPNFLAYSDIARAANDLRDAAGQMLGKIHTPIATMRPFTREELLAEGQLMGTVLNLRDQLYTKIALMPPAPELTNSLAAMREQYFSVSMDSYNTQLAIALKDGKYTMPYGQFSPPIVKAMNTIYGVRSAALKVASAQAAIREADARNRLLMAIGVMALIVCVVATISILFRRRLILPLLSLTRTVAEIAGGARDIAIPFVGRRDEVGEIAHALNGLLGNARTAERLAAEREVEAQAKQVRGEKLEQCTREFEGVISSLMQSLTQAAEGMTVTASSMSSAAEQTVGQSSAVSAASEMTSSNVNTVAVATEELSNSISEISRQVADAASIAAQAVEDARHTDAVVRTLSERAQNIGQVINLISGIASQTNLLALNATIEAARAGEAGKGFAVVASEVKNLAGQTNQATSEIADQIGEIQATTTEAVNAIEGIAQTIAKINEISTAIAAAVEEQGAATAEISRNVVEAARTTQEVSSNIGSVKEAAAQTGNAASTVLDAAGLLSQQASLLGSHVDGFVAAVKQA
ncbi:MAG TPA: methyl-accepting chemotaxis protein [Stellaceae bacterium]|nr:methyl-accepting chemotaxis protein [Stellaceae bacterium]